jgi:pyruvate/2-oxoacid:ferredoxin oxidoreductase alpha subunit
MRTAAQASLPKGNSMSLVDKMIAAVTPLESDDARAEARSKARAAALPESWLEMVLDHHLEIETGFARVASATTPEDRRAAQKALATVLTAHSIAEEGVLYPALALNGEKGHAEMSYVEQSATKVQMAALEELDPMSQDYLDRLEHIRGAVAHHVYEEEGTRFVELREKASSFTQDRLALRYREEFQRYCGTTDPLRPDRAASARTADTITGF